MSAFESRQVDDSIDEAANVFVVQLMYAAAKCCGDVTGNYEEADLGFSARENHDTIVQWFEDTDRELEQQIQERQYAVASEKFRRLQTDTQMQLSGGFGYEFEDDDVARLNELIAELRDLLHKSELFEPDHKRRLQARLEKLQQEVHKKVSDLDRFWGMVGDAGVALGKFRKDAKPFTDRIREMTQIIWKAQAKAEGLPAPTSLPRLEGPDEDGDD